MSYRDKLRQKFAAMVKGEQEFSGMFDLSKAPPKALQGLLRIYSRRADTDEFCRARAIEIIEQLVARGCWDSLPES